MFLPINLKNILGLLAALGYFLWFSRDLLDFVLNEIEVTQENTFQKAAPQLDQSDNYLHVFAQVSDIHVSRFYDKARISEFEEFCSKNIDIIKPEVVIVSGDLTDAKTYDRVGSMQYEDEWQTYAAVINRTKVTDKTQWLDIRGNHDVFGVISASSKENYFSRYSVQGKKTSSSYRYEHHTDDGLQFSFIAVNAALEPGPKRPFNFFGRITEATLASLYSFSHASHNDTMTFWFGHYPTSTITSPPPGFRELLGERGAVYMCGHLHTLLNTAPTMYTRHQHGNLELEVGDWKDYRIYRIFAVDHGMFAFGDQRFGEWPAIVVTNPKDARFLMPAYEPTTNIAKSTHIRLLVFSEGKVDSVKVWINTEYIGEAVHVRDALYVLPWKPQLYTHGLHTLMVMAKDSLGNQRTVNQTFSLDNTRPKFSLWYKFLLHSQFDYVLKLFMIGGLVMNFIPLLLLKGATFKYPKPYPTNFVVNYIQLWVHRLQLLANSSLYYPIQVFNLYVSLGPWFVGYLTREHLGICFTFGIYLEGHFIPTPTTYAYALFQYLTFNLPLMLLLARILELRSSVTLPFSSTPSRVRVPLTWVAHHGPISLLTLNQAYMCVSGVWSAYGAIATLTNPVRTWSIAFAVVLHCIACKQLPNKHVYVTSNNHNGNARHTRDTSL